MKHFYSAIFVLVAASCSLFNDESEAPKVLMELFTEPAGTTCAFGGVKVATGIDENRNNVLDDEEITDFQYCCNFPPKNGVPGKITTEFNSNTFGKELNPAEQSVIITIGHDLDNNGELTWGDDYFNHKIINNEIGHILSIHTDKSALINVGHIYPLPDAYSEDGSIVITSEGNLKDFDLSLFSRYTASYYATAYSGVYESLLNIELFNITDDEPIPNSKAYPDINNDTFYSRSYIPTVNYPAKHVEIGLRVSNSVPENYVSVYRGRIIFWKYN